MVHVIPSASEQADTLKALLVTKLAASQLDVFKRAFEHGAKVHLRPMMHLKVTPVDDIYNNATLARMRVLEDQAGNTDPFIVIDKNVVEQGAVWYVAAFADENDVENGFAQSEDVLMRALVRTERLAISHICWQQGNHSMGEELEALDSDLSPLCIDSEQSKPLGADDEDEEDDEMWATDEVEVIARAGEYETTTNYKIRSNLSPMPKEAVRLIPSVAKRENLISDWTWPESGSGASTPCSDDGKIPAGCVRFSAKYVPDFPRSQYQWPEGSL
ncbi:hypothetical protein E4T44_01881 [Aureobasidium sp. EXF-8845]|nr:hypothetical protein E4T44_01881 [Aureobasidium sp. EXF-8845]KAI4856652.1 hypothetical protein E4T45_01878 [Aureobasidium sp. EXF-8846]